MRIYNNVNAITTQNTLDNTNNAMAKSLEKLSTGLRINRASDDAAGLSVSEGLRTQIRGSQMAQRNANDGLAMLQIAEAGTQQITDSLQRMRELAIQSANGTYGNTDRGYIQQEFVALASEIVRISLSVTSTSQDVDTALASANRSSRKVQDAFLAKGVDKKDLQTSNVSIQPNYNSKGAPSGYAVTESMTASVRDLTKAGATLAAAVAAGGNAVRVDAVSFALEDTSGLVSGARKGAVDDAKAKAEQYAAAAGRSLGAVQSISEVVTSPTPQYMDGIAYARSAAQAAPVPLQAGSQDLSVQVTVVYALA